MRVLAEEAAARWPLQRVGIVHRLGHLELGDISIAVALSTPHRGAAFEAGAWLLDRLKATVPIWKKENWDDGSTEWVHPTPVVPRAGDGDVTRHEAVGRRRSVAVQFADRGSTNTRRVDSLDFGLELRPNRVQALPGGGCKGATPLCPPEAWPSRTIESLVCSNADDAPHAPSPTRVDCRASGESSTPVPQSGCPLFATVPHRSSLRRQGRAPLTPGCRGTLGLT